MATFAFQNIAKNKQTPPQTIMFRQINLQKSKVATNNLSSCMHEWSKTPCIFFLQEPWTYRDKVGISAFGIQSFAAKAPRAAVLVTSDLNVWAMDEFTTKDVSACLWKTGLQDCPVIVLISVYSDINLPAVSTDLIKLVSYCVCSNYLYIIASDTNAHSTLWGCDQNNIRGDKYEEFLCKYHLNLLNVGNTPTFQTCRASSIIDISLTHSLIFDRFKDWSVLQEDYHSDHKLIQFSMNFQPILPIKVKNLIKCNWLDFESDLQSKGMNWRFPLIWDEKTLESEITKFNDDVQSSLDFNTPTFTIKYRVKKNAWWNENLHVCRKQTKKACRLWQATRSEESYNAYIEARHIYANEIAKAKRESWQKFCTEAVTLKELAKINKVLQGQQSKILGLVKDRQGVIANSPEESINLLLDEHFPDSHQVNSSTPITESKRVIISELGNDWINVGNIRKAIDQFTPSKAAGPDGFKPIVLQHLPTTMLQRLGVLFKVSLALEYVPKIWRLSKVIFIPKQAKDDYCHTRSWRPISLMSFLFKTLERLILWNLEDTILKVKPMHKDQHAFRKGRSTESALSDTVDHIESEVLRQGFAIGVFLDIEGAFDNLLPEGVIESLRNRDPKYKLLNWFKRYLTTRIICMDHKGVSLTRELVKGTPQGGVLSPILWNLAFDEVLKLLDKGPVKVCGYADDLVLIGRGKDPTTIRNNLQIAIDKVLVWGSKSGLKFSATKSIAMMFTRRRKWKCDPLLMNGTAMEWQDTVKYLGVTLDTGLKWTPHITNKLKKAKRQLFMYRRIIGQMFGPLPNYLRWMYTGIVRPSLIYGAVVWWRRARKEDMLLKFSQLSRLAVLTWGPLRRSTPTAGLEILGYLPPIDLFLEGEVVKSWHRIKTIRAEIWDGCGSGTNGHRRDLSKLAVEYGIKEYPLDEIHPAIKKNDRLYTVETESFKNGQSPLGTVHCYTDGSRYKDRAGAGFCIVVNGVSIVQKSIPLGIYPTVFQAEIMAIFEATETLQAYANLGTIVIHSDSQAAIKALDKADVESKVVLAAMQNLDKLAVKQKVKICWVKAHAGNPGNEIADLLAKKGAITTTMEPEPIVPVPSSYIDCDISRETEKRWTARWHSYGAARQCKLFWPAANIIRSKALLKENREDFGGMVQLLTGHNHLNRHKHLLKEVDSPECRFCLEEEETSEHLLCSCPALMSLRQKAQGTRLTNSTECSQMPFHRLRRSMISLRLRCTEEGNMV